MKKHLVSANFICISSSTNLTQRQINSPYFRFLRTAPMPPLSDMTIYYDYASEEFAYGSKIEGLCNTITGRIGTIKLEAQEGTLEWLNELLRHKRLYYRANLNSPGGGDSPLNKLRLQHTSRQRAKEIDHLHAAYQAVRKDRDSEKKETILRELNRKIIEAVCFDESPQGSANMDYLKKALINNVAHKYRHGSHWIPVSMPIFYERPIDNTILALWVALLLNLCGCPASTACTLTKAFIPLSIQAETLQRHHCTPLIKQLRGIDINGAAIQTSAAAPKCPSALVVLKYHCRHGVPDLLLNAFPFPSIEIPCQASSRSDSL